MRRERHMTPKQLATEERRLARVSPEARTLFLRIKHHSLWVDPHANDLSEKRKALLQELTKAKLLQVTGRVKVMSTAYVPTIGFRPFENESWPLSGTPLPLPTRYRVFDPRLSKYLILLDRGQMGTAQHKWDWHESLAHAQIFDGKTHARRALREAGITKTAALQFQVAE